MADDEAMQKQEYTPAQLYKQEQAKKASDAQFAKRATVLATVKGQEKAYVPELRGTWISYTEKGGSVSPAIIITEAFKTVDNDLKMVLGLWVFSAETSQPYRTEVTY